MKSFLSALVCAAALAAGAQAQAQSCGSGGGTTVCLTAGGTANNVQLNWTVSGSVTALEVYRDTDSNPTGRTRIAQVAASTRSYSDASAVSGTPYWYWVKFTTTAGSYNSGAATGTRNSSCAATPIQPWVNTNSMWTQTASATVSPGTTVGLGPQPVSGGSWAWSGCGTSGSNREQWVTPSATCTATATYTNSCGSKSMQVFTVTVPGSMRNITSLQISKEMSPGWNLGNTLEAYISGSPYKWDGNFYDNSWGNPAVTQQFMNGLKTAGFKFVRMPVSWTQYADANDNIDPRWLAHVAQAVDKARAAGLYVMINMHDYAPWLSELTYAKQASNNARLTKIWTQIANYFKDYDDYLLFAGQNETAWPNYWGEPQAEWLAVHNSYNQTFVNAVRATGGNNSKRHLIVQGYATNIDTTVNSFVVPTDSIANRLFVEVHFYDDPYKFTLDGSSPTYTWGSTSSDPDGNWATEAWMDGQFQKLKTKFIDNGMPVLMGEYGAVSKTEYDPGQVWRKYWTQHVTRAAFSRGVVPMWWDTGPAGNHTMSLMNRYTGGQDQPEMVTTIVNASK
jgi:aryl-phospho-beta-D-glucosidase BglC (GH1 family)